MCTMIADKIRVNGSGKGADGWFAVDEAYVSYDHPVHAQLDHALNLDFVNDTDGVGTRVAVELDRASAARLADAILDALEQAKDHA
ncbi:MAG TPA: DUF6295 family protein [Dehalococcoidia bacterium]|nr:DUF6295 family protein [Dehalococcoidia bacterium]